MYEETNCQHKRVTAQRYTCRVHSRHTNPKSPYGHTQYTQYLKTKSQINIHMIHMLREHVMSKRSVNCKLHIIWTEQTYYKRPHTHSYREWIALCGYIILFCLILRSKGGTPYKSLEWGSEYECGNNFTLKEELKIVAVTILTLYIWRRDKSTPRRISQGHERHSKRKRPLNKE